MLACVLITTLAAAPWPAEPLRPADDAALSPPAQTDLIEPMRTGRARLSLMRADGAELAWVEGDVSLPEYRHDWVLPGTIEFAPRAIDAEAVDPSLLPLIEAPADPRDGLRLVIDRSTSLSDGGISGARGAIGNDGIMRLSSIASGEGEYDFYDLKFAWDALAPGPLTISLTGGLKAIDARIGKVVDRGGISTFEDARGVVAVPIIGGGVSWQIDDHIALTGNAVTQSFGGQGSVLDMSAETSIRLSPNIGISAGYQFIRSAIEVQSLGAELERDGVYARIRIVF